MQYTEKVEIISTFIIPIDSDSRVASVRLSVCPPFHVPVFYFYVQLTIFKISWWNFGSGANAFENGSGRITFSTTFHKILILTSPYMNGFTKPSDVWYLMVSGVTLSLVLLIFLRNHKVCQTDFHSFHSNVIKNLAVSF